MRVRGTLPGTRREGLIECAGLLLPTASRVVANRDPLFFPGRWSTVVAAGLLVAGAALVLRRLRYDRSQR